MDGLSKLRINGLRGAYALLAFGLGSIVWPSLVDGDRHWVANDAVVVSMLGALSALALVGLFRPLRMLPLLFFEIAWKAIFVARIAAPAWWHGSLDARTASTAGECLLVVVIVALVPWSWVARRWLRVSTRSAGRAGAALDR